MAKKSSKKRMPSDIDIAAIADIFGKVMDNNGISPEDLLEAMHNLSINGTTGLYDKFYSYDKPDYSKMVAPLHPALEPLVKMEGIKGISEMMGDTLHKLKNEDPDSAAKALINAIYYILANHKELRKGEYTNIPLFAILHMMIELNVKGATSAMIELLNQDGDFYEFFFDAFDEDMSFAISKLCKDDLKTLEDFMYATGRIPNTKFVVADGVIHMALIDPMMRIAVIAWFARVLKRYSEIVVYETNIDHITKSLAQLNADELKPLIKQLYDTKDIPFIEVESRAQLKKLMAEGTDERRITTESLADLITTVERNFTSDDDEYYGDDDDEDDDSELVIYDNEDGMMYRLEISLDDSPVKVTRELIVPSNIRLSWLGKALMATMGWENCHLDQFIKGEVCYSSIDESDPWGDGITDYTEYSLNEVLNRKGSKITWEYDFGDSWRHTIKLAEKIKYDGEMPLLEATKAEGACPPEDCGGVWGYADILEALKDKRHPEHEDWKEWVGPRFNPNKVSLKKINMRLKSFLKQF